MIVAGIDPGVKGGIAIFDTEKKTLLAVNTPVYKIEAKVKKKGKNDYDIPKIAALLREHKVEKANIELVHSMPRDGSASAFFFGFGTGLMHGCMAALNIEYIKTTPQKWKRYYDLDQDKNASLNKARELFPDCDKFWKRKKDDGVAEAALIGYYYIVSELGIKDNGPYIPL